MKKQVIFLMLAAVLMAAGLVITSCGEDDGGGGLKGTTWEAEVEFMPGMDPIKLELKFISDTEYESYMKGELTDKGTYKVEGNTITTTDSKGEVSTGTRDGNKINIKDDEFGEIVFKKK